MQASVLGRLCPRPSVRCSLRSHPLSLSGRSLCGHPIGGVGCPSVAAVGWIGRRVWGGLLRLSAIAAILSRLPESRLSPLALALEPSGPCSGRLFFPPRCCCVGRLFPYSRRMMRPIRSSRPEVSLGTLAAFLLGAAQSLITGGGA